MLITKTVNVIDLSDWDSLVEETYGRPYTFQQQDGSKDRGTFEFSVPLSYSPYDFENDSIPEVVNGDLMGVSFKAWLERDPDLKLEGPDYYTSSWWSRNFYPSFDMVTDDLHKRGLLEPGDYLINIDW